MANVAHLVRASGCGSEGRGFDPLHSPQIKIWSYDHIFIWDVIRLLNSYSPASAASASSLVT